MKDTPTPRTKEIWGAMLYTYPFLINCVTETEELETELNAALEEINTLLEEIDTLLEEREQWRLSSVCRELTAQLNEAREKLKAVTEQRDKLAELSGFGEFDKP